LGIITLSIKNQFTSHLRFEPDFGSSADWRLYPGSLSRVTGTAVGEFVVDHIIVSLACDPLPLTLRNRAVGTITPGSK